VIFDGEAGIPAGTRGISFETTAEARTRWAVAKQTLRRMFLGYVQGDISAFMGGFSADMEQDRTVFQNAAMRDFQGETSINVDLQILEYRVTFGQLCTRFLWNRNAVDQRSGVTSVQVGETYACFDRHDDFRVQLMTGSVPFGLSDPQLQSQVRAGQVNLPGAAPPATQPATLPPPAASGPFTVSLNIGGGSGGPGNVVAIDLETEARRQFIDFGSAPLAVNPAPGEDLAVYVDVFSPSPIYFQGLNGAQVVPCVSSPPNFTDVRNVNGLFTEDNSFTSTTFGVETPGGLRALVILNGTTDLQFIRNPSGNPVQSSGSVDCLAGGAP
jgi:hypothetical protein